MLWLIILSVVVSSKLSWAQTVPELGYVESEITKLNGESPKNEVLIGQYETLKARLVADQEKRIQRDDYLKAITQFPVQRERLMNNINDVESLDIFKTDQLVKFSDLSQSIASLQAALVEWRTTYQTKSEQAKRLGTDRTELPSSLAQLDKAIEKANLAQSDKGEPIDQWLELSNVSSLKLEREVLAAELQSLDERTEIVRLERQLLDRKIKLATPLVVNLQERLTQVEQASVRELIDQVNALQHQRDSLSIPDLQLADKLVDFANELEKVLVETDQARITVHQVDAERRSLTSELRLIKDNLNWLRDSTAFGDSIRAQLQRLPTVVESSDIPNSIAHAHIRKYEIGQSLDDIATSRAVSDIQHTEEPSEELNQLTNLILKQLTDSYDKLIVALSKLQTSKTQYMLEVNSARTFLQQQQLWSRSNVPLWQHLTSFERDVWLGDQRPFIERFEQLTKEQLISIGLLVAFYSVTLFVLYIRFSKRAISRRLEYQKIFGHPLKDKFRFTLILSLMASLRAIALPLWFGMTAYIVHWLWPISSSEEIKTITFAAMTGLFVVEVMFSLSSPKGVLDLHLSWPSYICEYLNAGAKRVRWPLIILLVAIYAAELAAGSKEAEISRVLFLVLIGSMLAVYHSLLRKQHLPSTFPSPFNQGLTLFIIRAVVLGSFVGILAMAIVGLYVASWVLLIYQQLTIFVILGGLFIYQLAERFLKLEHRQLTYQRLLERREELIAQQQEQADEPPELAELRESMPDVEERALDSEQVSEQSITLLRGLSLIGLVIALLTLWSSALEMTSQLNNVVVWQVSETTEAGARLVDITIQSLIYAVITLLVTMVGVRNLPGVLELLILRRLDLAPGSGYAITTLLRYLILVGGVLTVFAMLGFQWSRLQWLVAAFGVGLGFGLQEIFANFISGLILLFERPIRIGDIVTINELSGTVSKIQTRATTIIDWDNKEIVVPNKVFITEKLINWSLTDPVTRVVIPIGVAYGTDVEKVESLLYQIASDNPLVLEDPSPYVVFLAFGASSLDFELRVHITAIEHRLSTIHLINKNIDKLFRENNIEIAFPQMDIHVRDWPNKPS
ncbi:mechanosensitive ion channel domain-containing protein [Vibrio fortis]|uniref:mechanosensitive ion channel domain-containing protein n=1 Tax=Vibrio fortis TaxID=212667 RepID=UPI0021C3FFFA|nr:mechanosensitive ion channel domain-containing protein [Vibrio fortis]